MYGSYYGSAEAGWTFFFMFIMAIAIVVIMAWLSSINLFIKAAKEKGYYQDGGTGILWFIGIFATPIVVGLYVASLKPKSNDVIPVSSSQSFVESDADFPEI